jgi:thiamine kinase-like enzyme
MDDATLSPGADVSQALPDELRQIVDLISPKLGGLEGVPAPLEGGITNRNYRARFDGTDYVIRVPGKDTSLLEIDRRCEIAANERAARLGVAPPVAASLDDPPAIVTEFVVGTGMEPEDLREPAMLGQIAEALRRIHDGGEAPTPSASFDSFRIVETYAETTRGRGAEVPDAYEQAKAGAERIESALSGPEHEPVPCHDDLLAANFIRGEAGQVWIVDWEYAGMGDRYFDLANFAVNNELGEAEERQFLHAYFERAPSEAQLAALGLMKYMSDFREAMWGVVQTAVSELDVDFKAYARKHFDRMAETAADPSFESLLEEARGASA